MLTIGDHKQTDKKYRYENYPIEQNKRPIINSTKRNLTRIKTDFKQIDYTIWLRSLNKTRINYLMQIGIKDRYVLKSLIKMSFHHLPYDIRSRLQTKLKNTKQIPGNNLGPDQENTKPSDRRSYHYIEKTIPSDNQTASDTKAHTA